MRVVTETELLDKALELLRRHVLDHGHCEDADVCDCGDAQARRYLADVDHDETWLVAAP